jgi:hypothetical protein
MLVFGLACCCAAGYRDCRDPGSSVQCLLSFRRVCKGWSHRCLPPTLCPPPCSLLAGIRLTAPESQYILCLDDDVLPHAGLLSSLVQDMEAEPEMFMATGAPCPSSALWPLALLTEALEICWGCLPAGLPSSAAASVCHRPPSCPCHRVPRLAPPPPPPTHTHTTTTTTPTPHTHPPTHPPTHTCRLPL